MTVSVTDLQRSSVSIQKKKKQVIKEGKGDWSLRERLRVLVNVLL